MDRRLERRKCSPYVLFPTTGDLPQYFCRMMECWDPYTCESKNLREEIKKTYRNAQGHTLSHFFCRQIVMLLAWVESVARRNVEKHIEISRHIVKSVYSDVVKHIGRQVVKCFISEKTMGKHIGCHLCRDETRHTDVCGFIHNQSCSITNSISLERSSLSLLIRYYTQCPKPSSKPLNSRGGPSFTQTHLLLPVSNLQNPSTKLPRSEPHYLNPKP